MSDAYADNGDGTGVLSLYDQAGHVVASFRLQGSYTTADFLVTEGPNRFDTGGDTEDFQVDLVSAAQYGLSAGGGGASLIYVGPSGGAWGDAANWADAVTGAPATAAPGPLDTATIIGPQGFAYTIVTQNGDPGTLTAEGNVELEGAVAAQDVTLAAASYLLLAAGGALSTATLDLGAGADLIAYGNGGDGPGSTLDVTGSAVLLGGGNLIEAANNGVVELANATLDSTGSLLASSFGYVYRNGTFASGDNGLSSLTVGTSNDAQPGFVMVDPGATIDDLTPTSVVRSYVGGIGVVDDGTIYASNLELGETVLGDGAIIVLPGGITTAYAAADTALTFSAETGGVLQVNSPALDGGNSIIMTGTDVTAGITITGSAADQFVPAPITGFAYSDTLILASFASTIAYTASGSDTGTVTLFDATGAAIGGLDLVGNYQGVQFINAGDAIGLAEPGNFGVSPGTSTGNVFTFAGPFGAAWGDAANWTDTTTGTAAVVAPGSIDTAVFPDTIGASDAALQFVTGQGNVGTLQADGGSVYLDGAFTAGTLETTLVFGGYAGFGAYVSLEPGTSLTVGTVDLPDAETFGTTDVAALSNFYVVASGAGSDFDVTGTYEAYDIAPSNPAAQYFGSRDVTVENGGSAHIGAIVGAVTLDAAGNGSLDLPTAIGADNTILLSGTGDLVAFDTASAGTLSVLPAISGFGDGDVVQTIFAGVIADVAFVQNGTVSETATLKGSGGNSLGALTFSGDFTGHSFIAQQFGTTTEITLDAACYAAGSRIATQRGPVAVEDLAVGQEVVTASGTVRPIRWIGRRRVACGSHPRPHDVWPVRIAPGAFGPGLPGRELFLSPDHAVFVDGVLIPVRYLVTGATIGQVERETVEYWHVELDLHDVLLAEGLPCESYLDTGNRGAFSNGGIAVQMHPDFACCAWQTHACAKLVVSGAELVAARSMLLDRAARLGHRITRNPGLHVLADGREVAGVKSGTTTRFVLAPGIAHVRLVSRWTVPAQMGEDSTDHRRLGVAISKVSLDGLVLAHDDALLGGGWHDIEAGWRWTDGDAEIEVGAARELLVDVAMAGVYWADDPDMPLAAAA